jgi:ribosomal protein L11 methyltransferase
MKRQVAARPKSYTSVEFQVPVDLADDAAAVLVEGGALGCAVRDGTSSRHQLGIVVLQAFFEQLSARALARLEKTLTSLGMLARTTPPARIQTLVDPGWAILWQNQFKPLRIGRRFLVVPPWSDVSAPSRIRIIIQPGQAFGTGHHPTTGGVLRALELECARRPITSALDVGTGSGILAIAMKLLGVSEVIGIDIAPEAIAQAQHNAGLNRLSKIRFSSARLSAFRRRFDLIVANISFKELSAAAPAFKRLLAKGGTLILSGILTRETSSLLEQYRTGFRLLRHTSERGWTTLILSI